MPGHPNDGGTGWGLLGREGLWGRSLWASPACGDTLLVEVFSDRGIAGIHSCPSVSEDTVLISTTLTALERQFTHTARLGQIIKALNNKCKIWLFLNAEFKLNAARIPFERLPVSGTPGCQNIYSRLRFEVFHRMVHDLV